MSTSCDTAIILRQIICSILKSVVNGDWRKVFYNGITGNDRAARAEPSWLEFCRVVKEEDESQINGITEIEIRAICALAFSVLKEIIIITIIIPEILFDTEYIAFSVYFPIISVSSVIKIFVPITMRIIFISH